MFYINSKNEREERGKILDGLLMSNITGNAITMSIKTKIGKIPVNIYPSNEYDKSSLDARIECLPDNVSLKVKNAICDEILEIVGIN